MGFFKLIKLTFDIQAMYANTSVAAGMKGATKAMGAMNKVISKFD